MDPRLIAGLAGSLLLVGGQAVRTERRKEWLFAGGNACMFLYALLGYWGGGPVFFLLLQIFIGVSTLCMVLHIPDAYDTRILGVAGLALVAWAITLFQGPSTALFVAGLVLLGMGFSADPGTRKREWLLCTGSAVIAVFSAIQRDWIFTGLNAVFAVLAVANLLRMKRA